MAFSQVVVSEDQVRMVATVTNFNDFSMISTALRGNHGNAETVVNEILDDCEKVSWCFSWVCAHSAVVADVGVVQTQVRLGRDRVFLRPRRRGSFDH